MSSNTEILIKRSLANNTPSLLNQGELAYSYVSNTLFIGTPGSDGAIEIGHYSDLANLTAGVYGDATNIPIITVDAHGTVTNVSTSSISTTISLSSDNGSNTMSLVSGTLTISGGDGITTTIDENTSDVVIDVDDTVVRSNTEMPGIVQNIQTDVQISGNLTVQGTTTYVQSTINQTNDSLIQLAANNNVGDVIDIGFYGLHGNTETSGVDITGLVRNAGTSDYYLFDRVNILDETNIDANTLSQAFTAANGASLFAKNFLAAQSDGTATGGFSFSGTEGGYDTGMFSPADGQLQFFSNNVKTGEINPNNDGTSFGVRSAETGQGYRAIALGYEAGQTNQGDFSVAVGLHAGQDTQGSGTVAVGHSAGQTNQQQNATAVGNHAGQNTQGYRATAIGYRAAYGDDSGQGEYAVAVGAFAGYGSQVQNSIAINASGNNLNPTEAGLYIDPIRNETATGGNIAVYNTDTKEVVYTNVTVNDAGITLANGTVISDTTESGLFVDSLNFGETGNIVFYNTTTKEVTYGTMADLRGDAIANGSYIWRVNGDDGSLYSDQGTYIADSDNSVIIGQNQDLTNTNTNRVAIGNGAGQTDQGYGTTAVGEGAGNNNQGYWSVAVGLNAGNLNQNNSSTAVGHGAGYNYQGSDSVAIGVMAAKESQGYNSVAVGNRAGRNNQNNYSVAIGNNAGYEHQGHGAVAIGDYAGNNYQSTDGVAIGTYAGENSDNGNGWAPIAIGRFAGRENAGSQSVAIGGNAGNYGIGYHAVAIGRYAGSSNLGDYGIAIGDESGYQAGEGSISLGSSSGSYANNYSVAIGHEAGYYNGASGLGDYQIALGYRAAYDHGFNNSIVLNASGSDLSANASGFYVSPIRYTATQDSVNDGIMFYNQSTKEVRYSYALDGGSF
jgi:hypothetical protein